MGEWWPPRFTREERWCAARTLLRRLRERHGENLLAVALEGSTAKGLDRPESDLELRVVLGAGEEAWLPFFLDGLFVGISRVGVDAFLRDAGAVDYTWPVVGDVLFTAEVLHDPRGLYAVARQLARAAEARADFAALQRESLADMYEHVYKVFAAGEDEVMVAHEAHQVASWAANTVGLANRHRYLSSRSIFAESERLPSLPPGYGVCLRGLLALRTEAASLQRHTAALWRGMSQWLAERGVRLPDDALDTI
jgi:kanamycin nucleotidyltransferase